MADRGRDLELKVVTDTSQVDLDPVAESLDEIATSSVDAARDLGKTTDELKRVAAEGKDAERELARLDSELKSNQFDEMGKDAEAAGKKIDRAGDRVDQFRKSVGKVDDEAKKADRALGEMGREAESTGKEAAASFGGVEDSLDAVQELAANAFAGFGPAGAIAGGIAAAGIGLVFSSLQAAAEKANEAKDRVIELAQAIGDVGGNVTEADIPGKLREWAFAINDNKSWWELWQKDNTTNLEAFTARAEAAGISVRTMFAAMTGTEPDAMASTLADLNDRIRALPPGSKAARSELIDLEQAIIAKADETKAATLLDDQAAEALGRKTAADQAAKTAVEDHTRAVEAHASAIDAFTDPVGVYTDLLATKAEKEKDAAAATAAATKSSTDSWEDYAKDVKVSVDDYLDELERQVIAQEKWATNLGTLSKRGVDEGVLAELERLGPEGAPLIAKLTKASDKELARMVELFGRQGKAASTEAGAGIVDGTGEVTGAVSKVGSAAAREAAKTAIEYPLTVNLSQDSAYQAHREAERYFQNHPITVPVLPSYGTGAGQTRRVT